MKRFKARQAYLLFILILSVFLITGCGGGENTTGHWDGEGDGGGAIEDTTAPTVTFTDPADGATGVAINRNIAASFSEAMDPLTITTATFTLQQGATPISGIVTYSGVTAVFNPTGNLASSTTYTATITTGAKDLAGNALAANYTWSFTTGAAPDTTAPTVIFTDPADGETGVALNKKIAATFSEVMDPLTITTATFTLNQGATPISGSVTYVGLIATFDPTSDLASNTTYTATITIGAKDLAGNAMAAFYAWDFTTGAAPDTTAPTVILTDPANGETGVALNKNIAATFSEAMDPLTINNVTFTLRLGTTPISGTVTYSGVTAVFNPTGNLASNTTYTATITTGAKDLAGNALAADYTWSFTTGAVLDTTHPTVILTVPVDAATGVADNTTITATFSEAMDPWTIITANFTLMDGLTPVNGTVAYDVLNKIATFTPLSPLTPGTTYTALITTGATDLAGNALVSGIVPNPWSFTIAPAPGPDLGLATPFAIAATAGVTNTSAAPITHINGDVVLDPLDQCNAVTVDNAGGFGLCGGSPPTISGTVVTNTYPDTTTSALVKADLNAAFLSITPLAGPPAVGSLGGGIMLPAPTTLGNVAGSPFVLGDNYFTPGVYTSITSILITGDITLDGQGDPNAVFIFQSASSLTTADGAISPGAHTRILLTNGAKASNVWWQVASSATIGTYTEFEGNILAAYDITMKLGSTSCGRSMAGAWVGGAGAFVFVGSNVVSVPGNGCPL
jgi:hypothetical protein